MNQDWLEKDFYTTLEVDKSASAAEIKKKYRSLARKYHPDTNPGDKAAEEKFKAVSEAYDVLSDATKRKEYDETKAMFSGSGFRSSRSARGGVNINFEGLFGDGAGGLGDFLGDMHRSRGRTQFVPQRGADLQATATISFLDSIDGVTLPLKVGQEGVCEVCHGTCAKPGTSPKACGTCQGSGSVARNAGGFAFAESCPSCRGRGILIEEPCPNCNGSGIGTTVKTVNTRLPAGVTDGAHIRLKGKGTPGSRGGPPGDLIVQIRVRGNKTFGRNGELVTIDIPVTFTEAALGSQISLPMPRGEKITVKIPAGTNSGSQLRIKSKGIARKDGTFGDVVATVNVAVPQNLSEVAKDKLSEFAKHHNEEDIRKELFQQVGDEK